MEIVIVMRNSLSIESFRVTKPMFLVRNWKEKPDKVTSIVLVSMKLLQEFAKPEHSETLEEESFGI